MTALRGRKRQKLGERLSALAFELRVQHWPSSRKRSLAEILQGIESSMSQLEKGLAEYGKGKG
jgi:hypothetical protein